MSVSRFPSVVDLEAIAFVVGVPVEVVIQVCDTHSLPGLSADSLVGQATAERIARFIEGRA